MRFHTLEASQTSWDSSRSLTSEHCIVDKVHNVISPTVFLQSVGLIQTEYTLRSSKVLFPQCLNRSLIPSSFLVWSFFFCLISGDISKTKVKRGLSIWTRGNCVISLVHANRRSQNGVISWPIALTETETNQQAHKVMTTPRKR